MTQEKVIKILAGGRMAAKQASETIKTKSMEYIKDNILTNEFVTREEHEALRKLVVKLAEDMKNLKNS